MQPKIGGDKVRKNKKLAILAIFVVLGFLISTLGNVGAEEKDETSKITKEKGTTQLMGGGDYVFIRFNKDAAFGVIYGTEENPNSIITVAIHPRYLGGADVYDENGASLGKKVPIKVITILAHKLDDVFEFNDTNNDGLCNYKRLGPGIKYKHFRWHEPIYKKVSLETAWKCSEVVEKTDTKQKERSWKFKLTAENLSYEAVGNSDSIKEDVENETLEKIEFTFHLKARLVEIDNATIPYYEVRVKKGDNSYEIIDSKKVDTRKINGKRGKYRIKYDHEINGWDFDPTNENPYLLIEHHAVVGNLIPKGTAKWIKEQLLEKINGEGNVVIEEDNGRKTFHGRDAIEERKYNERKYSATKPRKMKGRYIEFGGNWEKIGRLTWVSNVTVDGQDKEIYAQYQGLIKFKFKNEDGNYFRGFAVLAGVSYPGGQNIYHDPELSSDILIESSFEQPLSLSSSRNLKPLIGIAVIVGLAGILGVAGIYTIQRQKKDIYHDSFDKAPLKEEEKSWEDFYK